MGDSPIFLKEEALGRLQIQLAVSCRLEIDQTWFYDLQSPFWRIYVHKRSGAFITHADQHIPLKPGRIMLIPAWTRFRTFTACPLVQDYLHFYVTGLPPTLLRRFFDKPYFLPPDAVTDRLCRRWQDGFRSGQAVAALSWASALACAAVAEAADNLPEEARRAFADSGREFSPIGPALKCIEHRPSMSLANKELARLCHLSTDHFIRRFRLIVGMTPARYGLEQRISLAAQWLTSTSRTIEVIAEDTGFTDRFHFSRAFKAHIGIAPGAYRRLHRDAAQGSSR